MNSNIALSKNGEVYTWGAYTYENDLGKDITENRNEPVKENLANISRISVFENNFYAIDKEGNLFVWGKGYKEPTKLETKVKIADIDGKLLLGQDGRVYELDQINEPIKYVNGIANVSYGTDHKLFTRLEGELYSIGKGNLGQLGTGMATDMTKTKLVRTSEGYLKNVLSISAGNKTSMALTFEGKGYVFGDNTNKKLGIIENNAVYATEITKIQDKSGNELTLGKIENVETGINHSSISDEEGFVYTVRTKSEWRIRNRRYKTKRNIHKNREDRHNDRTKRT
ncbi:MAG: hypothetical protein HFJ50_06730 [Clostridia bacterium]|jgi:alpha-tubulin suppressor-like RCC1 family protein|nr:hypothetical protein [Clostridia bacterium]